MTYILGIIQFILIGLIALYEFERKSSVVFMWATELVMFGIMHLFSSFVGDYQYSRKVLNEASIFVIGFCLVYILVRVSISTRMKKKSILLSDYDSVKKNLQEEQTSYVFMFILFVGAMLLKLIPYLKYVGNIFSSSWSTGRDYSATLGYANSAQLANIIIYAFSGLTLVYIAKNEKKLAFLVIVSLIAGVLFTRNRIEVLPLLCSVITIFLFKTKKVKLRTVIVVAASGIIVIYLVYALRVFRHYGTIADFLAKFSLSEFNEKIMLYLATDNGELGLRRDFYYFIDHNNQFNGFGKLHSYIRVLLVYLPTKWSLGIKPDDFAIAMGAAIGMVAGGSTHPTLFGDCFANAGMFGILLGSFWAVYATIIDRITLKRKKKIIYILMFVLNAVVYCIMGRGSVYNGFWFTAYGTPLLIVLDFCLSKFKWKQIKIKI